LTDVVKNKKKILYRVKEERNILPTVNRRKTNWTGHILPAKCLPQNSIEGNIEDEEEDVSSCRITLRKREDNAI
jgi:hypothetical protein